MEDIQKTFGKVIDIIEMAKNNAYRKVNEELIKMYWLVGKMVSEETKEASYGDAFVDEFYLRLCIRENYSKRELERQLDSGYYERYMLSILCASKDDEVVEYAMSRSMSPMLVSEYKLQLPDKKVLREKLQGLVNIPEMEEE